MKVTVMVAALAVAGVAFAQSARGPYHDRAEQEAALKRLSPQDELRVRAWAAEHPEEARKFQAGKGLPGEDEKLPAELEKKLLGEE